MTLKRAEVDERGGVTSLCRWESVELFWVGAILYLWETWKSRLMTLRSSKEKVVLATLSNEWVNLMIF